MRHVARSLLVSIVVLPSLAGGPARASVDYERRVDAHRAVERVLWERRIWPESNPGAKPPLEDVLPESALRDRVDDVLRKSNAIATLWRRPVGNLELQAEMDRMARDSRDPETLHAMIDALDRDPVLVAEVIARPALVDRLIRSWFASDPRWHAREREEAEAALVGATSPAALAATAPRYEEMTWTLGEPAGRDRARSPRTRVLDASQWGDFIADLGGRVQRGLSPLDAAAHSSTEDILAKLPLGRVGRLHESETSYSATVVLSRSEGSVRIGTGSWPKTAFDAWWSVERSRHDAILPASGLDEPALVLPRAPLSPTTPFCADDTWTKTGGGTPSSRTFHSAVWTGSEMIVWGGLLSWPYNDTNTGGRYSPATDSWSTVSLIDAPSHRQDQDAVWTGTKMIVWGGDSSGVRLSTGGRYDPTTDTWAPTTTSGAPTWYSVADAVWTGSRMIVWDQATTSGGNIRGSRYDPVSDSWSPMNSTTSPIWDGHKRTSVWTGSLVVLWPGKRYDPVNDVWMSISFVFQPPPRTWHTAVWTGSKMILWGGEEGTTKLNTGAQYDPSADTWSAVSTDGAPAARYTHSAVWIGGRMVVWGGLDGINDSLPLQTGGRYDPVANTWSTTALTGAPAVRRWETVVASSTEMIVWGGELGETFAFTDTGGRYNPLTNSWVPTRVGTLSPTARSQHSSVWTGGEMILWGGAGATGFLDEGWTYVPATDHWFQNGGVPPSARVGHVAVWTGTKMLVWGGYDGGSTATGGAYDPQFGSWGFLETAGAPVGRSDATAVWSGTRMIVWGGSNASGAVGTGGRYDPAANAWLPTSTVGAPAPRTMHTAVWTGSSMVVWGGAGSAYFPTGGRYDPATDSWTATTTSNAPAGRKNHAAAWTGSRMLIWGGNDGGDLATGSSYDPAADAWSPLASLGAPQARSLASAVWTGSEMIVWGGVSGSLYLDSGGRYRPDVDSWRPTGGGAPPPRVLHTGLWTGTEMIVWGGFAQGGEQRADGGRYCACVVWYSDGDGDGYGSNGSQITTCDGSRPAGAVAGNTDCNDNDPAIHPGVGDASCNGVDEDCDGQYDEDYLTQPSACGLGVCRSFGFLECIGGQIVNTCVTNPPNSPTDTACNNLDDDCDGPVDEDFPQRDDYWTATANGLSSRTSHTAAWSGSEMIVFGGDNGSGTVQTGGAAYAPASNTWRTLSSGPLKRWHHTAVWTGSRMVVWGGDDNSATIYNTGSRYDPATDTWATTTTTGAPTARFSHSAVWTGTRMVIWGGHDPLVYLNTGSRYDPVANTWSATATSGAPAIRAGHSAVWTGTEMIVWGGLTTGQAAVNTGGRYNPTTNAWASTTSSGAPSARFGHVAVWTGTEMIIWGGTTDGVTYLSSGARYNPATNTWAPINTLGAPGRRAFASYVWTGTELIIWGGTYRTNDTPDTPLQDGARYNPATDSWSLPTADQIVVPSARARATAVWTGSEMLVWGGDPNGGALSSGGRYNPRTLCGTGGCQQVGLTFCSAGVVGFGCTPLPPTTEVCDGRDNDCDVTVDEGIPVPAVSPTILGMKFDSTGYNMFNWVDTPDTTGYDVVRGFLGTLRSTAGNFTLAVDVCIWNDVRGTIMVDLLAPTAGDGWWYLVRSVNSCSGNATYDEANQQGSRDAEIAAAAGACP